MKGTKIFSFEGGVFRSAGKLFACIPELDQSFIQLLMYVVELPGDPMLIGLDILEKYCLVPGRLAAFL